MIGGVELPSLGHGLALVAAACGWWIAAGAVAAGVVFAGWTVWSRRRAAAELRRRRSFDVVPAADFDPSVEEVMRQTARVGRASSAAGAVPRRAAGVRFRTACVEGQLASQVQGPARAAGVLGMSPYADVQMRDSWQQMETAPRVRFDGVPPSGRGGAA